MHQSGTRELASKLQRRDLIGIWIFVTVWCVFTFALFYVFAFQAKSVFGASVTGLMALIGVYMLWRTIRMTLDAQKFGVVSLTPRQGPPVRPGGRFAAQLKFHDTSPAAREIEAELLCRHVTWSKDLRGGTAVEEETVWTARNTFPLRQTGLGASAEISFDIPADARPTDLPGERPGDSKWTRFRLETGKPLHFHRWEVAVAARTPGLDLERSFPVVIEPAPAGAGADTQEAAAISAAPPPRRGGKLNWIVAALMLGYAASFVVDFRSIGTPGHGTPTPAVPRPAAINLALLPDPPPQTPWTTDTSSWSMPMPTYARYLGIAANGIRSTRADGQELFTFDEIVIEKNPAWPEVEYFEVRFRVTYYDDKSGDTGTASGIDTRVGDFHGKLTAESPALVLRNRSILAPIPKGNIVSMRYNLAVNAVTWGRKYVGEKSREITAR